MRSMRALVSKGIAAPGSLNVYECASCHGWHVGHKPRYRRADQ
jgi:hypothetical protein